MVVCIARPAQSEKDLSSRVNPSCFVDDPFQLRLVLLRLLRVQICSLMSREVHTLKRQVKSFLHRESLFAWTSDCHDPVQLHLVF